MIDIFKLFLDKIQIIVQQFLLFKFIDQFTLHPKVLRTTGVKPLNSCEDRVREGPSSSFIFNIP